MKKFFLTLAFLMLMPLSAMAADVNISWDASTNATGYNVYQSIDNGVTWTLNADVGNVTYATVIAPDSGLTLFRVSAYNATGEVIRTEAGVWYNGDLVLPDKPTGQGIE